MTLEEQEVLDRKLIEITASLLSAAHQDERLKPLADSAKHLVLKSDTALAQLFMAFLNQSNQNRPPNPFVQRMLKTPQTSNDQIGQLVDAIKTQIEGDS